MVVKAGALRNGVVVTKNPRAAKEMLGVALVVKPDMVHVRV